MTNAIKVYSPAEVAAYFCGDGIENGRFTGMNSPTVTQFVEWNKQHDIDLEKAGLDNSIPAGVWFTPITDGGVEEWLVTDESGAINHYKKAGIKS